MRRMAVGRQIESDFHRGCGENKRGGSLWPPSWGGGNRDRRALAHLRRNPFPSHLLRYSRLNVSASARVRSASCIFLSFSVTSSTRAYTKSRIAARTASDRLGKSSTCTEIESLQIPRGQAQRDFFRVRIPHARHPARGSIRHVLTDERRTEQSRAI